MQVDACELVEINAKIFKIDEYYIEDIIKNLNQGGMKLTKVDQELLAECDSKNNNTNAKPHVKEGAMRTASIIICDLIGKLNSWGDLPNDKKSVLVFLPGLVEIFNFIEYCKDFYPKVEEGLEFIPLHSSLN